MSIININRLNKYILTILTSLAFMLIAFQSCYANSIPNKIELGIINPNGVFIKTPSIIINKETPKISLTLKNKTQSPVFITDVFFDEDTSVKNNFSDSIDLEYYEKCDNGTCEIMLSANDDVWSDGPVKLHVVYDSDTKENNIVSTYINTTNTNNEFYIVTLTNTTATNSTSTYQEEDNYFLNHKLEQPVVDIIIPNSTPIYQENDPSLNHQLQQYYNKRQDDLSKSAANGVARGYLKMFRDDIKSLLEYYIPGYIVDTIFIIPEAYVNARHPSTKSNIEKDDMNLYDYLNMAAKGMARGLTYEGLKYLPMAVANPIGYLICITSNAAVFYAAPEVVGQLLHDIVYTYDGQEKGNAKIAYWLGKSAFPSSAEQFHETIINPKLVAKFNTMGTRSYAGTLF